MNAFQVLNLFLEGAEPVEVEGRGMEVVPESTLIKLKALAAGTLSPSERAEVVELLKEHPHWVSHVASEARLLRENDEPPEAGA